MKIILSQYGREHEKMQNIEKSGVGTYDEQMLNPVDIAGIYKQKL
jgi:hypothetical protein